VFYFRTYTVSCYERQPTQIIARLNVLYVSYVATGLRTEFTAQTAKPSHLKMLQNTLMVIIAKIYRQSQSYSLYRLAKEVGAIFEILNNT
jgi:hypothetical protein